MPARDRSNPGQNPRGVATGSDDRETAISADENPPPPPPAAIPKKARSACEEHRAWIQNQVELGRNAQSVYGQEGIRFYTRQKSIMQRWPQSTVKGSEFVMPSSL